MDEGRYRFRHFQESDYPAEARIAAQINPERPSTPEEIRYWDGLLEVPPFIRVKLVVEDRSAGEAVGFGHLFTPPWTFDPRKFWVGAEVDRAHEGHGIGSAIAEAVLVEATRRQAVCLWSGARASHERSVRFLLRHGFEEKRRVWQSRLEVGSAVDPPDRTEPLARAGISFTTLAEEGADGAEVRHRLYELAVEASVDIPRMGPYTPLSFDRFVEAEIHRPGGLPDAFFLARHDDRYVGLSNLTRLEGDPEGLEQDFTGVRREWRERGIASELKRRTLVYARAHGYRYIQTFNDSLNRPMWAINERLGYRKEATWVHAQKDLAVDPSLRRPG